MRFHTEKEMAAFGATYLQMIAVKYGGDTTINEVRVMNSIFRHHLAGTEVGVSLLSEELDIPKSTVSRAVLNLRSAGWLVEDVSGWDGRRRFLRPTAKLLDHYELWKKSLVEQWPQAM